MSLSQTTFCHTVSWGTNSRRWPCSFFAVPFSSPPPAHHKDGIMLTCHTGTINRFVSNKSKAQLAGRYAKKKGPPSQSEAVAILRHMKSSLLLRPLISFFFFLWRCDFNPEYVERWNSSANSIHRKCLGSRAIAVHMKGSGEPSHCRLLFGDGGWRVGGCFLANGERGLGTTGFMFCFYPLLPTHVALPKHKARWIIYNVLRRKKNQTRAEGKCCFVTDLGVNYSTKSLQSGVLQMFSGSLRRAGGYGNFSAHTTRTVTYQKLRFDWFSYLFVSRWDKKKAASK